MGGGGGGGALTQWNADTKDKMYRKEKGPKAWRFTG